MVERSMQYLDVVVQKRQYQHQDYVCQHLPTW
jgi:hypothetical protein